MKIRLMHPKVGELSYRLREGEHLSLGRGGEGVDVELNWDQRVSRKHGEISMKGGRVCFLDLNSKNGSWHGDQRLKGKINLDPGMTVLIGETILAVPETHECVPTAEATQPGQLETTEKHELHLPVVHSMLPALVPESESPPTADLRSLDLPLPDEPQIRPEDTAARQHPRFVAPGRVELHLKDRDELRQVWLHDISKGGLFVETNSPPAFQSKIEVLIDTPDGKLVLHATVVHVVDRACAQQRSMPAGVGLQFSDLNTKKRKAIQQYVDGLKTKLAHALQDQRGPDTEKAREVVKRARALLDDSENQDLYVALGLWPTAMENKLSSRIDELEALFSQDNLHLTPPQATRVQAARSLLKRIRSILCKSSRRLDYDFRNGHVRADERIYQAKVRIGPSIDSLRAAWNRAAPTQVDRAALLTRQAFEARQKKNLAIAVELGEAAVEHNPFFLELRRDVKAWKDMLQKATEDD